MVWARAPPHTAECGERSQGLLLAQQGGAAASAEPQRHRAVLQRPATTKLAAVYRGGVVLGAITIWLRESRKHAHACAKCVHLVHILNERFVAPHLTSEG